MTNAVDILIRGTLVNVHTGTFEDGAIAIDDGQIVALEERPADREFDVEYVSPGLIDAHMHVESSMVTLPQYGQAVVPRGVVGIVHDPHEIGNVLGEDGVRSVVEDGTHTPLKARFTVPSSVPASDLQASGATIGPDSVDRLLEMDDVVALGEVMNVPGVVTDDDGIHEKIELARERGLTVDGHMPRVTGSTLQKAARFLDTDHESITLEEARDKVAAGVRVYLREGSSSKNLSELAPLTEQVATRYLSLCTDDRDVSELLDSGGIDSVVRTAIAEGIDPMTAVQMATINTAESYDLPFGRLKPGAPADLVMLSDLETWAVEHVLIDGVVDPTANGESPESSSIGNDTMSCGKISPTQLIHSVLETDPGDTVSVHVIDAVGGLQTARMEGEVPISDGDLTANLEDDILPLAVIDRHRPNGDIGTGFVHQLGLSRGAIASTVAHDAHNLVVAGVSHEAMATVANHLREIGGGIAAYDPETDTLASLALPVAGLMSDRPLEEVSEQYETVEAVTRQIGLKQSGLMEMTFLSLEVIPEIRLTSQGLVDVDRMTYTDVLV